MPNAGRDEPAEVLVDRYLESSEGGGVRPSTAKGGGVATLSTQLVCGGQPGRSSPHVAAVTDTS